MKFDIFVEDLGVAVEVTAREWHFLGKMDEFLFRNGLDSCGAQVWTSRNEVVFSVPKESLDWPRLLEVLRRYDFSEDQLKQFVDEKLLRLDQPTLMMPKSVYVVDRGDIQEICTKESLGLYGPFDDNTFFTALFLTGIDASLVGDELELVVPIPKFLPEWQSRRVVEVLLRYRFPADVLKMAVGLTTGIQLVQLAK